MRTLIIRLFSPVGEQMTRLQGLVQQPGRHAVRFLGADQLIEVVTTLGRDDDGPGLDVVDEPGSNDPGDEAVGAGAEEDVGRAPAGPG